MTTEEEVETPAPMKDYCSRYHRATEMIGRRWASSVLRVLLVRPRRFNEILHSIPGLSDRLLTERLRELGDAGLVMKALSGGHIEYALTPAGRDLGRVVGALREWVENWMPQEGWPSCSEDVAASV